MMTRDEILDTLLLILIAENKDDQNIQVPREYEGKRRLLRVLMNVRPPQPVHRSVLDLQDQLLSAEIAEKTIINPYVLPTVKEKFGGFDSPFSDRLVLWKGDITTIAADAIVNAANSKLLGCFIPLHNCIDNAIHSAAGIQLRLECNETMLQQGYDEPTGQAKITMAYNLPSKYVLHTVGPIVGRAVTDEDKRLLTSCYTACLNLANEHDGIRTIAFCCISTGEFRFPKAQAARVAIMAVCEWLNSSPDRFDRIIFNVFTREDNDEYENLFREGPNYS